MRILKTIFSLFAVLFFLSCNAPKESLKTPEPLSFETPYLDLLEEISRTIGDAPIIALGEPSHFLQTVHMFANDMFKYLVEREGFRVFILEAAWAGNDYLMDFIRSDAEKIDPWMNFYLNAFGSIPTENTLLYVREHNAAHPDDPIQIGGMQPEQPLTDYNALVNLLERSGIDYPAKIQTILEDSLFDSQLDTFVHDIDVIVYHGQMRRSKEVIITEQEYETALEAVDGLENLIKENEEVIRDNASASDLHESRAHILGLRFYLDIIVAGAKMLSPEDMDKSKLEELRRNAYQTGDAYRFEIIKIQMETRFKGQKMLIWMHNWHASRNAQDIDCRDSAAPPKGTNSLGVHLDREFGSDYVVIGTLVAMPDHKYEEGREMLERSFFEELGETPAYIDLKNPGPRFKNLPLSLPTEGLMQSDLSSWGNFVLTDQFDGVAYFPRSIFTFEARRQADQAGEEK